MTQSTIDSEVDEELDTLWECAIELEKALANDEYTLQQYMEEKQSATKEAAQAITNLIAQEANKARLQTAIDFATRLKLEFTKRDLSSDNMPKGYRKLTNEELITKVWGELTADKEQND